MISDEGHDDIVVNPPYQPQSGSDSSGNESEEGQPTKKVRKVTHFKRAKAKALCNTGEEYVGKEGKFH